MTKTKSAASKQIFEELLNNYLHPNPTHQRNLNESYIGIGIRTYFKKRIIPGIEKTRETYRLYIFTEPENLEQVLHETKYEEEITLKKTKISIKNQALGLIAHLLVPTEKPTIDITTKRIMTKKTKTGVFSYVNKENLYLITTNQYEALKKQEK